MSFKKFFGFGVKVYQVASIPISTNIILNFISRRGPISIVDFLNDLSPAIDKEVIKIIESEDLTANGGEIKIYSLSEKEIGLEWDYYFTDTNGIHIKKSSKQEIPSRILIEESLKEIEKSPLIFPITPPLIKK